MVRVPADDEVSLASFLKVLGTGSSGTVWLVAGQDKDGERADEEWCASRSCFEPPRAARVLRTLFIPHPRTARRSAAPRCDEQK